MGLGRGNRVALSLVVLCSGAMGIAAVPGAPSAGAASDCASLGAAANFAVFSNGAFTSSNTSGPGRVAAAGDVTLDAITVSPAANDASPTVVAGRNFIGGQTGAGGTVNGGVSYGGTANVAPNFTVNGGLAHAPPPFSFDTEFTSLKTLSSSLGALKQSPGASVVLQPWGLLELTGTASGLNVFSVDAAELAQAQGVAISLSQPGATALINVTTDTLLTVAPSYMTLTNVSSGGILWNLPLATGLAVNHGVAWEGSILAPTRRSPLRAIPSCTAS